MNFNIVGALVKKEFYQIIRDPSSILIAFILPLILLFLFGFGINFDTNTVKLGVIVEDYTPKTIELVDVMRHSRFLDVKMIKTREKAADMLSQGTIRGFVVIPNNFTAKLLKGSSADLQVIADGSEPNTAKFVESYVQGSVAVFLSLNQWQKPKTVKKSSDITLVQRFWYNPALKSIYFILPGSLAIIMTMIGTVLTALVIAREWERGTMEALLTTDVTRGEFLLAKYLSYFVLGMASIVFCLFFIIFIFRVPYHGSLTALFLVCSFFILGALGFGFLISTAVKDQFIASQIAGVGGFMPAMMLSGLIYEIDSMPAPIRFFTYFIPARYFVSSITSLFLSGTVMKTLVINSFFLITFAVITFLLVYAITPERFENC